MKKTKKDDLRADVKHAAREIERYLGAHAEKIARTAARETGSPISYQHHDIEGARAFLKHIGTLETLLSPAYRYEPKGNILIVLSANEPIITATILAFSGLFMGNTVCMKPSSKSPSYARLLAREVGRIPDLRWWMRCLAIDPKEIERRIRAHDFDRVLSFGSRSTNRKLGITCAEAEVEFLPESEGNDWAYVDKDCGGYTIAEMSALIVESFTRHNGQMCNALRGVMVHASVCAALLKRLKEDFSNITVGSPLDEDARIGTLIAGTEARARQIVEESAAGAAQVWTLPAPRNSFTPMIVVEPKDTSTLVTESIFAPVLWVKKVKSHTDAIALFEERNRHGLGFSVFSKDKKMIDECVRRIPVGRVNVNKPPLDIGLFDPLGGIGLSGRGGPSYWIEKMSDRKFVNQ
mgnify:CR=1 FL=1